MKMGLVSTWRGVAWWLGVRGTQCWTCWTYPHIPFVFVLIIMVVAVGAPEVEKRKGGGRFVRVPVLVRR